MKDAAKILTDYCNKEQKLAFLDAKNVLNDIRWYMSENSNTMKNVRVRETNEVLEVLGEIAPLDLSADRNLKVAEYGK